MPGPSWTPAIERFTLYCTWRSSALTTRPPRQVKSLSHKLLIHTDLVMSWNWCQMNIVAMESCCEVVLLLRVCVYCVSKGKNSCWPATTLQHARTDEDCMRSCRVHVSCSLLLGDESALSHCSRGLVSCCLSGSWVVHAVTLLVDDIAGIQTINCLLHNSKLCAFGRPGCRELGRISKYH